MNEHNLIYDGEELVTFGHNHYEQLGLGDYNNRNIPVLLMRDKEIQSIVCGLMHTLILKKMENYLLLGAMIMGN